MFRPDAGLTLMDQVRQKLRYHHYAYRTEQTYCDWIVLAEIWKDSTDLPDFRAMRAEWDRD
jgi:hypothetical protein